MKNSVRTNISVLEFEFFEFFLDANKLYKVRLGFYKKKPNEWASPENYVVYEIPDDEDTQNTIIVLTLKHSNLEKAYREFRNDLENNTDSSLFYDY